MPTVRTLKRPIQTPYGRKAPGEVFECSDQEAAAWVARRFVEPVVRKRGRPPKNPPEGYPWHSGETQSGSTR